MEIINGVKVESELTVDGNLTVTNGNLVVAEGDIDLVHVDKQLNLPTKNDSTNPTLSFGDGDSGLYESSDDTIKIAMGGYSKWVFTSPAFFSSTPDGVRIDSISPSATNPCYTFVDDTNTGLGKVTADTLSCITGGVEAHRMTEVAGLITHELTGTVQGSDLNNQMVQKATFDILGLMTDPRFLNLQCEDPGAGTMYDVSGQGHDGTYQSSMASGDRIKKGMGWAVDFDGIDDCVSLGDHNDFSFGDASNDEAVTWFGVIEVVAGVGQILISKYNDTGNIREWFIFVDSAYKMKLRIYDESATAACNRTTDAALSVGYHSFAITYDGAGGATAANTVKIYIDGALVASTASNNANYVAMENTVEPLFIGRYTEVTNNFFYAGDIDCLGIDGSEWSAFDVHRFHQLCNGLYGL